MAGMIENFGEGEPVTASGKYLNIAWKWFVRTWIDQGNREPRLAK
jgi:hypothetical protein